MTKKLTAIFLILLSFGTTEAQDFESALNSWRSALPTEKIHLQLDQPFYVPGEKIWFKAYLYNDEHPATTSSNLFIQLINGKGELISQNRYPLAGAISVGNIAIPDSLPQANYYLRAFTPAMLDQTTDHIYVRKIPVVKIGVPVNAPVSSLHSIKFFPESGALVDSVPTVIAFKATDLNGTPIETNGIIKSSDGMTVSSFKTDHDGMGRFIMVPGAGTSYSAEVSGSDKKAEFALPPVQSSGIVLHVEDERGGKLFQLSRSVRGKELYSQLNLVVEINQHIVYENSIDFEDFYSVKGHLLTEAMPSGILHFAVFDKKGKLLVERLAFVNNNEYQTEGNITVIKKGLGKRTESVIELSFSDAIERSCSIAVVDATESNSTENSIFSDVLLTADLTSFVNNADWYFENQDAAGKRALDNLLIMENWRRFDWAALLNKKYTSQKYRPFLSVSGKLMDEKKKENLSGGRLEFYLEASDSTTQSIQSGINNEGTFHLDSLLFFGNARLFYAYLDKNEKQREGKLILDEDALQQKINVFPFITPKYEELNVKTSTWITGRYDYSKSNLEKIKELEKVTLHAKTKRPSDVVNEKYATGVFQGQASVTLDNINEPVSDKSLNALDYIRNRIQQVDVTATGMVNKKNLSMSTRQRWPVGIFLNEIPTDINTLRMTRMSDVALVKFFEAGFVGVSSSFPGGAVSVYTKHPEENEIKPSKLPFVQVRGYKLSQEFNIPDYSTKDSKHSANDNRATVYWNPDVLMDARTRSIQFRFYNNDVAKKLKVIVEGFDAKGKLIHLEKIIE